MTGPDTTDYLLDNSAPEAEGRFAALSAVFDPVTERHLDALGLPPAGRFWEVGAGGSTVPIMLADRAGATGHVVATDIDVDRVRGDLPATVEVRRHDVASEEPPGGDFDLVHARLVLVHVPDRDEALRRMIAALRPGGRLLVEDFDVALQPRACLDPQRPSEHRANRIRAGFVELLARRGADLEYGRKLPRLLRGAGLCEVTADAVFPVAHPGAAALEIANVMQVREGLIAHGYASVEEIDAHLGEMGSGRIDIVTPPLVSASGRLPETV
ncbi:MAG: methyltransferase domain-containing protein [Pseudonocardia sp.]|nr:methyltransferase domain-containing protein [Pseudonocardia sp.]